MPDIVLPRMPQSKLDHIPGDTGLPLLGHTLEFIRDCHGLSRRLYQRYGPVHRTYCLFQHTVILLGPEANEIVLTDREQVFSSRFAWNPLLDALFPNGLMLRDFEDHRYHRRLLQAAFKKDAVSSYLQGMNDMLVQSLRHTPELQGKGFTPWIKSLLLDIAAQVFLGVDIGPEADRVNASFVAAVDASIAVLRLPVPGTVWYRGLRGRAYLEQFIDRHYAHKQASGDQDFFAQICRAHDEEGRELTPQAVRDHLIFLLFAAHDTTTSTLSSIIYLLARHPQWQHRLREEIKALDKDTLAYEDLSELSDVQLVFREALRLYPPLSSIPRRATRDTEILGYPIPANTGLGLSPLFTHYMEDYWDQPARFDPERFAPARAEDKRHFFQYIPFGGGHHKCLGLNFAEIQSKLFLFHFLKRYAVSVDEDYVMPVNPVPLSLPLDGLRVRVSKL